MHRRPIALTVLCFVLLSGSAMADGYAAAAHVDTTQPSPVNYPAAAQAAGEQGPVDIRVQIDSHGKPTGRYQIAGSSSHPDLDMAALQSVLNWHYVPARDESGARVTGWVALHIDYKLPQEGPTPKP